MAVKNAEETTNDFFVHIVETEKRNLAGYTLIEGFPGMGLVGTISVKYLTEKLGFSQMGFLQSNLFMPVVRVHEGLPVHACRIFVHPKLKLVALVSEQVVPGNKIDLVATKVVEWIKEKKIRRVISLSGIQVSGEEKTGGSEELFGFASNAASRDWLRKNNIQVIREGVTTGINALVLLALKDENIEAVCLLGMVRLSADYTASAALLKKLNEMLDLSINLEPLHAEARETEKAILDHFARVKDATSAAQKFEEQATGGSNDPPMYT